MKTLRLIALLGLALGAQAINAATMTIYNKGTNTVYVKPMWGNRCGCYDEIKPGAEIGYDSGVWSIYSVKWAQILPSGVVQLPGQTNMKIFEAGFDLNALTLGAKFEILNDGSYVYKPNIFNADNGNARVINGL